MVAPLTLFGREEIMPVKLRFFRSLSFAFFLQTIVLPSWAQTPDYSSDTRAYNLAHGRVVFNEKCMRCHEGGRKGAPVFGELGDWEDRLEQPLGTLIQHAIRGHGDMPARGDADLSDSEVAKAVAYVVDRTRAIAADELSTLSDRTTGEFTDQTLDGSDKAAVHMFFLLLGQDRWK